MFEEKDKSTFKYWLAHICAYNMIALVHDAWKFKYLFHDFEKPFMRLFMPYEKVRVIHRKHNRHHPEWLNHKLAGYNEPSAKKVKRLLKRYDFEGTIIDWECSRFTKPKVLNAYEEYTKLTDESTFFYKYPYIVSYCKEDFKEGLIKAMQKLRLI